MKIISVVLLPILFLCGCSTPAIPQKHVAARPLFRTQPIYPAELWAAGKEGKAVIEFIVTTEGNVVAAEVVEADHPLFGLAARDAVLAISWGRAEFCYILRFINLLNRDRIAPSVEISLSHTPFHGPTVWTPLNIAKLGLTPLGRSNACRTGLPG